MRALVFAFLTLVLLQHSRHGLALQLSFGGPSRLSRKSLLINGIAASTAAIFTIATSPAFADSQIELQKLEQGYAQIDYLVNNFEKETTICGRSDNPYIGLCERTPLKIMEALGFKSTKSPLFQADKTMMKLQSMVPPDKTSEFIDAVEQWNQAAEEASGIAYVSSWAEANPGGGKDRVALYIERSRKNVIDAREALRTVIAILK
jgi:hypothetical protein